ncbi:MAG TPA: hypothetical protein VMR02_15520 [Terracidiphilus sp.]|jgi:hypothetical protein|nr:hypothetical protein [Terracidiphilus sp.]
MNLHAIGIDLGKTVFHLVDLSHAGEVVVPNDDQVKASSECGCNTDFDENKLSGR